jgi:hypothetical protein
VAEKVAFVFCAQQCAVEKFATKNSFAGRKFSDKLFHQESFFSLSLALL